MRYGNGQAVKAGDVVLFRRFGVAVSAVVVMVNADSVSKKILVQPIVPRELEIVPAAECVLVDENFEE